MTGIMSLMPALLGVPMDEIVRGLPVETAVREALLDRLGMLGAMLSLAEGLEAGDSDACARAMSELGNPDADDIGACQNQALAWARNIGREAA